MQTNKRLLSLDALRGFDMIWILGAEGIFTGLFLLTGWSIWQTLAQQFEHSHWHGFTFYDLIFPLFIFLSGVTLGIANKSLSNLAFPARLIIYKKAIIRVAWLCLLGIIYNHGWGQGVPAELDKIRYASVLMRIAVAWFGCALIVWHFSPKAQLIWAGAILFFYWVLLLYIPTPLGNTGELTLDKSWNSWVDQNFLPGASYRGMATDPEGILSHLPAIVNALAGAFAGRWLMQSSSIVKRVSYLCIAAIICLLVGYLWSFNFPINKTLWTSTFVLVTVGYSSLLLALFYLIIDFFNWHRMGLFFAVIGANAILFYLGTSLLSWSYLFKSLFGGFQQSLPENAQYLFQIILVVMLQWLLAKYLYSKRLFLKI